MRRRILFLAEHVTWSQVVRLLVLARSLDPRLFEVHFASASFDERLFAGTRFRRWPIHSISPAAVERAMATGNRLYDVSTLGRYVEEERRLFDAVRPHLVVSDLRWSTTISAPLASVPCATLVNAYWSPHFVRARFPLPEHPIVRVLGVEMAERYFPIALPKVFAHFAAPVNTLRKKFRLPEIGSLQEVMTFGDRVLFPDDPALAPLSRTPDGQTFLGPVLWSPDVPLPDAWDRLGTTRPLVYVTLGSSGSLDVVPIVLEALGTLDVDVLLSTARRFTPSALPSNVVVCDMVPGDRVARRASVVVCNGGASTGHQALAEGTPIVGIPSNLDAYLSMTAMHDAGVGRLLRAGTLTARAVRDAVHEVSSDGAWRRRARAMAASFARFDAAARFLRVVDEITGASQATETTHGSEYGGA